MIELPYKTIVKKSEIIDGNGKLYIHFRNGNIVSSGCYHEGDCLVISKAIGDSGYSICVYKLDNGYNKHKNKLELSYLSDSTEEFKKGYFLFVAKINSIRKNRHLECS